MGAYGSPEKLDFIREEPKIIKCKKCKMEYRDDFLTCPNCGTFQQDKIHSITILNKSATPF